MQAINAHQCFFTTRAKHAIIDYFHSFAVEKALTTMVRLAHKKTLTNINVEERALAR